MKPETMTDTPKREPLLSEAQASKMAVDADTRQLGGIAVQRYYENLIDTGALIIAKQVPCPECWYLISWPIVNPAGPFCPKCGDLISITE